MAKMEMPNEEATDKSTDTETPAEDTLPGDSFSEQISKLSIRDKDMFQKLVERFNAKK
jgi:hypothetical protein